MESRIIQIRIILNNLVNQSAGSPRHSGRGRFWNQPRDQFITGPIYGKIPIVPGHPDRSFLIKILEGPAENFSRMPLGGPYISSTDLQFISQWITDGAPDADSEFLGEYSQQS